MNEQPLLVVFGGPNGSGKSSLKRLYDLQQADMPQVYINADDLQKSMGVSNLQAAQEADRQRQQALSQRQSFATETLLSTEDKINLMRQAKAEGYEVHLHFMTTQSSEINKARVSQRVQDGGHDVPGDKIAARYERAMELLPKALQVADVAWVYNNSFEHPKLIVSKSLNREIELYPQNPPNGSSKWTPEKLEDIKRNVTELDKRFQQIAQAGPVKALPRVVEPQKLFDAYAKEELTKNKQVWKRELNQDVARSMLKNGVSMQKAAAALACSPDKLTGVHGLLKTVAKEPQLKAMLDKSRGHSR